MQNAGNICLSVYYKAKHTLSKFVNWNDERKQNGHARCNATFALERRKKNATRVQHEVFWWKLKMVWLNWNYTEQVITPFNTFHLLLLLIQPFSMMSSCQNLFLWHINNTFDCWCINQSWSLWQKQCTWNYNQFVVLKHTPQPWSYDPNRTFCSHSSSNWSLCWWLYTHFGSNIT